MERIDIEERNAKCNLCACELSVIENILYGNRCVFCFILGTEELKLIGLLYFLLLCYYDYKIYQETLRLIRRKGFENSRILFLACISEIGMIDIGGVRKIRDKRALLKVIRRVGRAKLIP